MNFSFSIFFLVCCDIWGYKKIGNFFNPICLFSTSLLICVIAVLISDNAGLLRFLSSDESKSVLIVYNLAVFFFVIPWALVRPKKEISILPIDKLKYKKIAINLSLFLMFMLFIGFVFLGGAPIFKMMSGQLNVDDYNTSLKNLPFGLLTIILSTSILLNLYLSSFIANRGFYKISPIMISLILLLCLFASLWQGKRQGLLMLIFMVVGRLMQKKMKLNFAKKVATAVFSLVVLLGFYTVFTQVSRVRTNSADTDSFELLSYAMYPAMNMVTIIDHVPSSGLTIVPKYITSEVIPWRFATESNSNEDNFLFEPTSPSGYFSNWYMNYGYIGVITGALLISFVSKYFYLRRLKSEHHMRLYVFILWCCATVGIYSHLINLNFFIFPLILLLCLNKIKLALK